jgi:hypothetical protein
VRLPDQPDPSLASQRNGRTQQACYDNDSNDLEMNVDAFAGQEQDFDALHASDDGVGRDSPPIPFDTGPEKMVTYHQGSGAIAKRVTD